MDFLDEHEKNIKALWEKSEPLKKYPELYRYAADAEADYERFLEGWRNEFGLFALICLGRREGGIRSNE